MPIALPELIGQSSIRTMVMAAVAKRLFADNKAKRYRSIKDSNVALV